MKTHWILRTMETVTSRLQDDAFADGLILGVVLGCSLIVPIFWFLGV